jgi:hypothetical protein
MFCATLAGSRAAESTDDPVQPLRDGVIAANGAFTLLSGSVPEAMRLADTGLLEAGLVAGEVVRQSDEIRIYTSKDAMQAAPLARIWLNQREGGQYWFLTGGEGAAADFVIPTGAAVLVWTRAGLVPVTWQNVFE